LLSTIPEKTVWFVFIAHTIMLTPSCIVKYLWHTPSWEKTYLNVFLTLLYVRLHFKTILFVFTCTLDKNNQCFICRRLEKTKTIMVITLCFQKQKIEDVFHQIYSNKFLYRRLRKLMSAQRKWRRLIWRRRHINKSHTFTFT